MHLMEREEGKGSSSSILFDEDPPLLQKRISHFQQVNYFPSSPAPPEGFTPRIRKESPQFNKIKANLKIKESPFPVRRQTDHLFTRRHQSYYHLKQGFKL